MITNDGMVKILDFGLAKLAGQIRLTRTGTTMGTVAYMPPEQARGEEADQRTDIWSLGVVLSEMLMGKLPFKGEYEQSVIYSILNEKPIPIGRIQPGIPIDLESIVTKAPAKNRADRYKNMAGYLLFTGRRGRTQPIHSLAVLPLTNLFGDPQQKYFVDGMTEALITELSQISALKVISRTSVMQHKGAKKPLPQIARELGVGAVIEGSVLRAGERVRISAQLIQATTDSRLWTESYERDLRDMLTLQSEVARAIAGEIKIKLTPQEEERLASARKVNPDAYQLYQKGRYLMSKATEPDLKKSIEYFEQAIEKDPTYAAPYASIADAYLLIGQMADLPLRDYASKAKNAVLKALEIDDTAGEAHSSLADIKFEVEWDWERSDKEFKRTIQLSPNYAYAYTLYSQLLNILGRHEEATEKAERAEELDPLNPFIYQNLSFRYYFARGYDKAIDHSRKFLEIDPNYWLNHWRLGLTYSAKGIYDQAIEELKKAIDLSEGSLECLPDLGKAYARSGKRAEALKILDKIEAESKKKHIPSCFFAPVYTGLGDKDHAFEYIEKLMQSMISV